jgi:signal transduction histidine kinase
VARSPGGGAIFRIELPAAAKAFTEDRLQPEENPQRVLRAAHAERARRIEIQSPLAPAGQAAARVLVVEDEPIVARLIADVLEDEGMRVDVLLDGWEALERAARERYDLVICDMKMPGLNGQHFYNAAARHWSDGIALCTGPAPGECDGSSGEDFGEILRHKLNNPLTGILGNAELLLVEMRRKNDYQIPSGGQQRETIAALAVRMRETVRAA